MAAAARALIRALRALAGFAAGVGAALALFALAGWIGSAIPRNAAWVEPPAGIDLLIESNGIHTGIVVPVVTPEKDWRRVFPAAGLPRGRDQQLPTHIGIGWGERDVFMATPTWGDLKPSTVLRIATVGSDTVLRVSPYVNPQAGTYHRPLRLTYAQYRVLAARIEASLAPPGPGGLRPELRGFDPDDAYYPARGTYTLARTCNSWTGEVLGDAGVRVGWWTPFAGGVTKWFPDTRTGGGS